MIFRIPILGICVAQPLSSCREILVIASDADRALSWHWISCLITSSSLMLNTKVDRKCAAISSANAASMLQGPVLRWRFHIRSPERLPTKDALKPEPT